MGNGLELHGKTKIELFNAESGELEECIEEENTLTGALAEIFQGIGRFGHGDSLVYKINATEVRNGVLKGCYDLTQWFGGLLAFDIEQDETHPFASANSKIIASGVYEAANIDVNQVRGSYNHTESVLDWENKRLTFVYDFATNQGNGDIRCICLTPLYGGYMNEGRARTEKNILALPLDECYQPNRKDRYGNYDSSTNTNYSSWLPLFGYAGSPFNYFADNWDTVVQYDSYYPLDVNYQGKGTIWKILEVDTENNKIIQMKMELNASKLYITFISSPYASTEIDVWYGNGAGYPKQESTQIELDVLYNHMQFQYFSYDYENRKLYVVCAPFDVRNYTYNQFGYACTNAVEVASMIKVHVIDVDPIISDNQETYNVVSYDVVNNTNQRLPLEPMRRSHQARQLQFFCYDGYMYVYGPNYVNYYDTSTDVTRPLYIYKIEIAHPANVVQIQTDITNFAPYYAIVMDAHDGRIYLNFGSNVVRVLNTYTNELYAYEELLHYDYENYGIVSIRNHYALATENGHLIGLRPNVLMTVNNITKVTKTSAQTMKISYTISG